MKKITADDIQRLTMDDFSKMTKTELKPYVDKAVKIVQNRKSAIKKAGLQDISYIFNDNKNYVSVNKNMTRNQLLQTLNRSRQIINAKTSTVSGAKQVQSQVIERLGDVYGTWTEDEKKKYWNAYNKTIEENKGAVYNIGSERLQQIVADKIKGGRVQWKQINKAVDEEYEKVVQEQMQIMGLSFENTGVNT